ncbi:MAG: YfiT family bacillithiol transferase [Acidobacteriaceae bacterium]
MDNIDQLRYPIGKFNYVAAEDKRERDRRIGVIAALPAKMRAAVAGLSEAQLETPYREGGWTVRQVIHHVPDSHMQSYSRFKLALTEDDPAIKGYEESAWAKLPDSTGPIEPSLALLEALHARWTSLLRAMTDEQWQRNYVHPEMGKVPLEEALALYVWHGQHHQAHIRQALKRG